MKRQGDLLIMAIAQIPDGCHPKKDRVLAEGERRGHLHELTGGDVYEKKGTLYFKINHGMEVTLIHPEHASLTFVPGTYKVIRQREYLPEGWRYVID